MSLRTSARQHNNLALHDLKPLHIPLKGLLYRRFFIKNHCAVSNCVMAEKTPDETLALLTRLSQKPGVQSTLVLSRDNGAIVRTSGLISNSSSANPNSTLPASTDTAPDNYTNGKKESGIHSAEDVASMVWSFITAAGSLVEGLDTEDEVKLLRLRTKKNELVIVPDPKFILVVVHDTPPV
ncbi:hypothetical protein N0V90_005386 [Kalmusia sp. IMI 367209]|nr:hypothetical protein N0V90_005386 [Kalmusia sp. IMI 367209]